METLYEVATSIYICVLAHKKRELLYVDHHTPAQHPKTMKKLRIECVWWVYYAVCVTFCKKKKRYIYVCVSYDYDSYEWVANESNRTKQYYSFNTRAKVRSGFWTKTTLYPLLWVTVSFHSLTHSLRTFCYRVRISRVYI